MKSRKKSDIGLEQYFTPQPVADRLAESMIQIVGEEAAMTQRWLEPSAGAGAFIEALVKQGVPLDHIDAFDLEPRHPHVQQADFLEIAPTLEGPYLTIGNPPYGRQSSIAIEFFNACASVSTHVGFVVPISWRHWRHSGRVDKKAEQVWDSYVGTEFHTVTGSTVGLVRSSFLVWRMAAMNEDSVNPVDRGYVVRSKRQDADLATTPFSYRIVSALDANDKDYFWQTSHDLVRRALRDIGERIRTYSRVTGSSMGCVYPSDVLYFLNQWFDEHPEEKAIVHAAIEAKKQRTLFDLIPSETAS